MSYSLETHALPSKIIYLDSRDASTYLSTNDEGFNMNSYFQYVLNEQIEVPSNMNCLVSLNGATIPYSFYNIRSGVNDRIDYSIIASGTTNTGTGTFTIPAGNYSAISLGNYVEENMPDVVLVGTNYNFTMTMDYQPDSQKYRFTFAGAGGDAGLTLQFQFLFASGANSSTHARIELGFRTRDVLIIPTTSEADRTSDNVVDINGSIHGVYIRTNLVSSGTLDTQNGTFSNILARIPIKVQSGGIIFSEPSNNLHKNIVDVRSIGVLTIRLTDERNRILDLNGLHFQLGIQIDFVYKKQREQIQSREQQRDTYNVVSDTTGTQRVNLAMENTALKEELIKYQTKYKVGRPRKVGRPNKEN